MTVEMTVEMTYRQNQNKHSHVGVVDEASIQGPQLLYLLLHGCGKHDPGRPAAECRGTFEKDPGRRSEYCYETLAHLC